MAIQHAKPGDVIDLKAPVDRTTTLFKTDALEAIRLVAPAGHEIKTHSAPGELTLQCLRGKVAFETMGRTIELSEGQMVYLAAREPHALKAHEDAELLLTIEFPK